MRLVSLIVGIIVTASSAFAQLSPSAVRAAEADTRYPIAANVPYPEGVRLHEALAGADDPDRLLTVPGGGHGGISAGERVRIYTVIREFLAENGL
jgi:hypothetical protein